MTGMLKMQADNKALLDGMCRFIGVRADHMAQLTAHAPQLLSRKEALGKEFYWYALKCPETLALLSERLPGGIDSLVDALLQYCERMLTRPVNGRAARRVVEQGRLMRQLGVGLMWVVGAYERCQAHFLARLAEAGLGLDELAALSRLLRKRILLDQMLQLHGHQQSLQEAVDSKHRHLQTMSGLYATLSGVSMALVRCSERGELFQAICDVCVREGDFSHAWVGLLDAESQSIRPAAMAGVHAEAFIPRLQVSALPESLHGRGPSGRAIRGLAVQVVNDCGEDPSMQPWMRVLNARNVRSALVAPLTLREQVIGTLSLYSGLPGFFDDTKVALVDTMAREISRALERQDALERSHRAESELAFLSFHDPLTGLPNRHLMKEHINKQLQIRRANAQLAVLVLSIEGFHEINARLGHEGGDAVLCEVANRLRRCIYPYGYVGRVGASRFVACSDRHEQLDQLVDSLMGSLQQPVDCMGVVIHTRCSMGIVVEPANGRSDAAALLRRGELALSRAKEAGGGHCRYYHVTMDEEIQHMHAVRNAFALAIARDELALFYQPKINLRNNRIEGVEALVRWRRDGRLEMPGAFFPAIENTDLMRELDWWVLREALRQSGEWLAAGRHIPVSVNLSAITLKHEGFVPGIQALLQAYPLPAGYLELEVLESVTQQEAEQITAKLEHCRDLGLSIALDDFGTGASSLVHLQQLPFDTIKIDQRFVRLLLDTPGNEAIIRSMVSFAHYTGRKLVVEGVESRAIWDRLLEIGCLDGQGYEISPPVDPRHLPEWIADWEQRASINSAYI
ncbi:EAL domain-containing protein [Chromobacterium alkanivorans]|uniref:EAL domain-containing protein n=2 Tax=Chromobacteriaceae TaxID=1499392 RepID=UPI0012E26DC7